VCVCVFLDAKAASCLLVRIDYCLRSGLAGHEDLCVLVHVLTAVWFLLFLCGLCQVKNAAFLAHSLQPRQIR
jgi:hypothetical protein